MGESGRHEGDGRGVGDNSAVMWEGGERGCSTGNSVETAREGKRKFRCRVKVGWESSSGR